jgi:hypothetical protein
MGERFLPDPPGPPLVVEPPELEIFIVMAGNVTGTAATVNWATNLPATSQVFWGIQPDDYVVQTEQHPALTLYHSVILTDLIDGETIYFKVVSTTPDGQTKEAVGQPFQVGTS